MITLRKHITRRGIVAGVTICCLALLTADAAAQTNERIYEDLDFRFVTPGARAVGMGKTFVGLADDATAAESNPAGMSNLLEQEFSVEFIGTQIKHERFIPGGNPPTETFGEYVTTPSFLSYVLPLKRLTVSFYRHTVQDYRESFGFAERALPGSDSNFEDGAFGTIVAESENHGVSGAFVVHPRLSIGGSWAYSTLSLSSRARSASPERRGRRHHRIQPSQWHRHDRCRLGTIHGRRRPLQTASDGVGRCDVSQEGHFPGRHDAFRRLPSHQGAGRSVNARIGDSHRRPVHD